MSKIYSDYFLNDCPDDNFIDHCNKVNKSLSSFNNFKFTTKELNDLYTARFVNDTEEFNNNLSILVSPIIPIEDDIDYSDENDIMLAISDFSTCISIWRCYLYVFEIISGKDYHSAISLETRRTVLENILSGQIEEIKTTGIKGRAYKIICTYLNEMLNIAKKMNVEKAIKYAERKRIKKMDNN